MRCPHCANPNAFPPTCLMCGQDFEDEVELSSVSGLESSSRSSRETSPRETESDRCRQCGSFKKEFGGLCFHCGQRLENEGKD